MFIRNESKLLFASVIISAFELFDFVSFIFLSPILCTVFLPPQFNKNSFIITIISVTISYVCRPIGGIVLANFGDKYGRKSVFAFSVLIMAIPSLVIGFSPTYQQVGILAPILLIFCRILHSFSIGGEFPGAVTYLSEVFKDRNIFYYCSWLTFGANIGLVLLSQFIKFLTENTTHYFMYTYGWRLPFLTGSILTGIVAYIRKNIKESADFNKLKEEKKLDMVPFLTLIRDYKIYILLGISLSFIVSITTAIFHLFLPSLLVSTGKISIIYASNISSLGAISLAVFSVFCGYIARFVSVKKIIKYTVYSITILICGYYFIFYNNISYFNIVILVVLISVLLAGVNGVFFGVLAKLFPTNIRFSGISTCFNCAYILGVGITPIWVNYIVNINSVYFSISNILLIYLLLIVFSYSIFYHIEKKKLYFD